MNATRILPDLQCALLCEDVRPEANGNFILVGVLGLVHFFIDDLFPHSLGRPLFP